MNYFALKELIYLKFVIFSSVLVIIDLRARLDNTQTHIHYLHLCLAL